MSLQTTTVDTLQRRLEESAHELTLKDDDAARSEEQAWNAELESKLEKIHHYLAHFANRGMRKSLVDSSPFSPQASLSSFFILSTSFGPDSEDRILENCKRKL